MQTEAGDAVGLNICNCSSRRCPLLCPPHAGFMQRMAPPFGLRRSLLETLQNPLVRLLADLELHLQLRQQDLMLLHNMRSVYQQQ